MKLRDYQQNCLNEITRRVSIGDKEIPLSACPSSGKTFMAIQYMLGNPDKTFLVLTHGTNVLKKQWQAAFLDNGVEAALEPGKSRITFGIPQSLRFKDLKEVDVLIIDEAHEFNFAKKDNDGSDYESMVEKIKETVKPKHILYLTGTPSKFIKHGLTPIIIPAIELIEKDYISDLYVGMVSTNADLKNVNSLGNLTSKSIQALENSVEADLDNLLEAMVKRLSETGLIKAAPEMRKLVEWAPTLGKLHKTMIACESVKQAEKVSEYFSKRNIKNVLSHNENDPSSEMIDLFVEKDEIKVLVVVKRGILGFNMENLVNVVDLTGSRNIDRIYQLYARVMRKSKDHKRKYFFKISDEPNRIIMQFYMNAALMLMFPDFISKYNGKNLNGCGIITFRAKTDRGESKHTITRGIKNNTLTVDPIFMSEVTTGKLLKDIWNKIGKNANEYAYVTFGEILQTTGKVSKTKLENPKQQIIDFCKENKRRPSLGYDKPEEHKLANYLGRIINPTSSYYDEVFATEINNLVPKDLANSTIYSLLITKYYKNNKTPDVVDLSYPNYRTIEGRIYKAHLDVINPAIENLPKALENARALYFPNLKKSKKWTEHEKLKEFYINHKYCPILNLKDNKEYYIDYLATDGEISCKTLKSGGYYQTSCYIDPKKEGKDWKFINKTSFINLTEDSKRLLAENYEINDLTLLLIALDFKQNNTNFLDLLQLLKDCIRHPRIDEIKKAAKKAGYRIEENNDTSL